MVRLREFVLKETKRVFGDTSRETMWAMGALANDLYIMVRISGAVN
jgi:hypothetical protein